MTGGYDNVQITFCTYHFTCQACEWNEKEKNERKGMRF
jgi:hypothetical protein